MKTPILQSTPPPYQPKNTPPSQQPNGIPRTIPYGQSTFESFPDIDPNCYIDVPTVKIF